MSTPIDSPSVAGEPVPGGGDGSPVLFADTETTGGHGALSMPDKPVDRPDLPADPNRSRSGHFVKGNTAHKAVRHGGYNTTKQAKLRAAVLDAATPEQLVTVLGAMIVKAVAGDVAAASLVFERVLGKALPGDILERLARIESKMDLSSDLDPDQMAAEGQVVKRTRVATMLFEAIEAKGAEVDSHLATLDEPHHGGDTAGEGS